MPLGTMILPALITPKSSFPSLSISLYVSLSLSLSHIPTIICKHTILHTHHMPRPALRTVTPWISSRAGDLWCRVIGWEDRIWWNCCLSASILYSTPYIPSGHEWFSYENIWGGLFSLTCCYTRCLEWSNAVCRRTGDFFFHHVQ